TALYISWRLAATRDCKASFGSAGDAREPGIRGQGASARLDSGSGATAPSPNDEKGQYMPPKPLVVGAAEGARPTRTAATGAVRCLATAGVLRALPGSTTTMAPTAARRSTSSTASLSMRMQPLETCLPMLEGSLVPWMRYC